MLACEISERTVVGSMRLEEFGTLAPCLRYFTMSVIVPELVT
jgi:hypothetical protein